MYVPPQLKEVSIKKRLAALQEDTPVTEEEPFPLEEQDYKETPTEQPSRHRNRSRPTPSTKTEENLIDGEVGGTQYAQDPISYDGQHKEIIWMSPPLSLEQFTVDDGPVCRPHHDSYFIGRKVAEQRMKFLVNTGCTTY